MPRQLLLQSFTFIAPLEDWDLIKNKPQEEKAEEQEPVDDFFGGGDLMDAAEDGEEINYIPSRYLPLTCCRSIFFVMTPFVAMNEHFDAISETDLELFQLTPTLDFTLSLNLNFHGNEDRSSKSMFESLGKIRFLSELKLQGRVSESDFKQIGQLHFLTSLDLSKLGRFTDDIFSSLHGLVNLKRLDLSSWGRLTSQGMEEITKVAPNLETLILEDNGRLDSLDAFANSSLTRTFKTLSLDHVSKLKFTPSLSKLTNLQNIKIYNCCNLEHPRDLSESLQALKYLRKFDIGLVYSVEFVTRELGKGCGDTLEVLNIVRFDDEYGPPQEAAVLVNLARYFKKNLRYLNIATLNEKLFRAFLVNHCHVDFDQRLQAAERKNKGIWSIRLGKSRERKEDKLNWYYPEALQSFDEVQGFLDIIRNQDEKTWSSLVHDGSAIPNYTPV